MRLRTAKKIVRGVSGYPRRRRPHKRKGWMVHTAFKALDTVHKILGRFDRKHGTNEESRFYDTTSEPAWSVSDYVEELRRIGKTESVANENDSPD